MVYKNWSETRKKQIQEARIRKEKLIKHFNLNSKEFDEIKNLHKSDNILKIINDFEREHNTYVYHYILTYECILTLLYVSMNEEQWENDKYYIDRQIAYVYNLSNNCAEFEGVTLESKNNKLIIC